MPTSFRGRVAAALALSTLVVVLAACSGQDRVTSAEVESAVPPTSPQNVLQNIAFAYRTRDFELYRAQFDPDLKVVLPERMQQYLDEQPGYDWEMKSTESLFRDADWITFEMMVDPPRPSTVDGYPGAEGHTEIKAYAVHMKVQPHGSPDTWVVDNDEALLVLKKDTSVEPAVYRVVYMEYQDAPEEASS